MTNTYIFWGIIIILAFIILKKIASIYILDSNGNSIKTEESLMAQAYILLISAVLMVLCIIFSEHMKDILHSILFAVFSIFCSINVIWFFSVILDRKQKYIKSQSTKMVISSHFLKNIVLLYFLYNYYELLIR